jgi:hypothetical protein
MVASKGAGTWARWACTWRIWREASQSLIASDSSKTVQKASET